MQILITLIPEQEAAYELAEALRAFAVIGFLTSMYRSRAMRSVPSAFTPRSK